MPLLTVSSAGRSLRIPFASCTDLCEILQSANVDLTAVCAGTGACGLCRVQVVEGDVPPLTRAEELHLSREEVARNIRLACQLAPCGDLVVELTNDADITNWRPLPRPPEAPCCEPQKNRRLALAADIGTTAVRLSILDLESGYRCAGRVGRNPQSVFGPDVMTRLQAAAADVQAAERIQRLLVESVAQALQQMRTAEHIALHQIERVVVVGNTAEQALLSGRQIQELLKPAFWDRQLDCAPAAETVARWRSEWDLHPEATVQVVPSVAGFVGSDLLASVLAADLVGGPVPALLVDFGTNSEIALWDGAVLRVTSAAGGPAFEGSGMTCGMTAEPGAVWRIICRDGALVPKVLGGVSYRGICGSGFVDLIACLRESGAISMTGALATGGHVLRLALGSFHVDLTKKDVDLFQRAKAAVGVGIETLLAESGLTADALQRVCVGGAFGQYLNVQNARSIGLLPNVSAERVELCGNTALTGCEALVRTHDAGKLLAFVQKHVQAVNLASCPDFDDRLLENLFLCGSKRGTR